MLCKHSNGERAANPVYLKSSIVLSCYAQAVIYFLVDKLSLLRRLTSFLIGLVSFLVDRLLVNFLLDGLL